MAKHPASEHHRSAADKHREAEEAHRRAHEAHERNDHDAASEHANQAQRHGQEAAQHGDQARDAYNPEGRASRTDLPPEASGLDQNTTQGQAQQRGPNPRSGRGEPQAGREGRSAPGPGGGGEDEE